MPLEAALGNYDVWTADSCTIIQMNVLVWIVMELYGSFVEAYCSGSPLG